MGLLRHVRVVLEMIKFEHTVFALPFALMGMMLAAGGWPPWRTVGWIVVAMVGARSAAMGWNRLVDRDVLSDPAAVLAALGELAGSGRLWPHLARTVGEVLAGYAIGVVAGVGLTVLVAAVEATHRVLRPFLVAFYSIPKIALARRRSLPPHARRARRLTPYLGTAGAVKTPERGQSCDANSSSIGQAARDQRPAQVQVRVGRSWRVHGPANRGQATQRGSSRGCLGSSHPTHKRVADPLRRRVTLSPGAPRCRSAAR